MWIVKTLGRRTRNGADRVFSVNGSFITQDVEEAADAAIEAFAEEVAGNVVTTPDVPVQYRKPAPASLHDLPSYWDGTWRLAEVS